VNKDFARSIGKQARVALQTFATIAELDDDTAAKIPDLYLPWEAGNHYVKDDIVRYNGVLYRVKSTVTSDKTPDKDNSNYQVIKSK